MTQTSPSHRGRPSEPALLRLSRPEDLVAAVPYLVGFHPRDSLVLIGLRAAPGPSARSRVSVVVRMDLADANRGGLGRADPILNSVMALERAGSTSVTALVFRTELPHAMAMAGVIRPVRDACAETGLAVASWFFVGDDRWCSGAESSEGVVFGEAFEHATDSVVAAQATYAGLVARPDRAAVEGLLTPEPAQDRSQLLEALTQARRDRLDCSAKIRQRCRRADIRALFAATRELAMIDAGQLVRFGAALADVEVRDACWMAIEGARIDGSELWRELARVLPDEFRAPALFLFGWQQWRDGSGALAGIAIEECLRCDPGYRAAELLDGALLHGLDPFHTPRLRKGA